MKLKIKDLQTSQVHDVQPEGAVLGRERAKNDIPVKGGSVSKQHARIYFSSGTTAPVIPIESTMLLPMLFIVVALLFVTLAQTLGRAMEEGRPLVLEGPNLPTAGWQFRQRKLWSFTAADVTRLTIRQRGKTRQLQHNGPHLWSLAPGSQGIVDDLATEETVRGLVEASAVAWVARGENQRSRYGFTDTNLQLTLELKTGPAASIEFGGEAPSGSPYAAITLDGQLWIFEFPWPLGRDVLAYLSIPGA